MQSTGIVTGARNLQLFRCNAPGSIFFNFGFSSQGIIWSPYIHPLMHHAYDVGVQLTSSEKVDLIAFIKTLRDDTFLTNPDYSAPERLPDGAEPV